MTHDTNRPALPWWRVRMVWLVVGGPAVVVVASFATLVLAVRGGDTPLLRESTATQATAPMTPATQARNHANAARR